MSISDIINSIILILGFLIALFTYVYTVAMKPRLSMVVGQEMLLHYTYEKRLIVTTDFVFLNGGAQPGALIDLSGTLSSVDGGSLANRKNVETPIRWEKFEETQNIADPGKPSRYYTRSAGMVHTLIVPGRAAGAGGIESTIRLFTKGKITIEDKHYLLELTGLEGSKLARECKASCCLQVQPGHAQYLLEHCVENQSGTFEKRLSFTREIFSKRTFRSRLLGKPTIVHFISHLEGSSTPTQFEGSHPS